MAGEPYMELACDSCNEPIANITDRMAYTKSHKTVLAFHKNDCQARNAKRLDH